MAENLSNWNFKNFHVQRDLRAGQFVNAETTLIASGPPAITDDRNLLNSSTAVGTFGGGAAAGDISVYPIGLLENFALSQSKQLQRIFEIGSSRSYFIPGRVIGSVNLGRVFYFGPSLMRVLYAYYTTSGGQTGTSIGQENSETIQVSSPINPNFSQTLPNPDRRLLETDIDEYPPVAQSPGEDYFYINLASDLFNQPLGLAVFFKDTSFNSVGAVYLEDVYIQSHQMTISSGSVLIMEGVSAQYDQTVPIKMTSQATTTPA